jgi:hypothetical protein
VAIEDDRPWAVWWLDDLKHDKSEKPASRLSKLLKPYGTKKHPIKSRPIRLSDKVARGYAIDDFKHAFERYLPPPEKAVTSVTSVTSVTYEGTNVTAPNNVTTPGAKGVTQIPLVEPPFVTGVTAVTPFRQEAQWDGKLAKFVSKGT